MKKIEIRGREFFDQDTETFFRVKSQTIVIEHSLVSISKWESKWKIPFLATNDKTNEQLIDYVRCMTLTQNVDPNIYKCLSRENIKEINEYINDKMTATWFNEHGKKGPRKEILTSELIYYSMIQFNIPVEFQKWHLNRLLTLIRICGDKNTPPKKMSKRQTLQQYSSLNAQRRAASHSKG